MRKLDKLALAQLLFAPLVVAAVGCADGTEAQPRLDAGIDRPADVASADMTEADAVPPADTAKSDAPAVADAANADTANADTANPDIANPDTANPDTANADALPLRDGAVPDVPRPLDASPGETPLDSGRVDATPPRDAGVQDVFPALDADTGEAGTGIDGPVAVDALAMSMPTITFRLDNTGAQTVYLRNNCWIRVAVVSESDATDYSNAQFCACDCADSACTGTVMCGPCAPPQGVALDAGTTKDIPWIARKSAMASKTGPSGAFQCVAHTPIPTGAYRVAVVVYPSASDAAADTNGKSVARSFTLGTTNATVTVSIQ
jgi:hypothetical protein